MAKPIEMSSNDFNEVLDLTNKGVSYEEIGRQYGVSGSYIRKFLKKNGADIPKRRKIGENEHFNKGKVLKEKPAKEKKPNGKKCKFCGNELFGRQEKFCSKECKEKEYSKNGYHTKYARKQDATGAELKTKYIKMLGGCCSRCGYKKNIASLVFHHLDPSKKKFNIGARTIVRKSRKEVEEEISKCIVLCQNCHNEIHYPEYEGLL